MKKGILLLNLGTPDSPSKANVRSYLTDFLNDPRVIDISAIGRSLLVNLFIIPFKTSKSASLYSKIWTDKGSPLLFHGKKLQQEVQSQLGNNYVVELAMRYKNPSITSALLSFRLNHVSSITVLPLFPQYASSSTGSAVEAFMEEIKSWEVLPEIKILGPFFQHPGYIESFIENGKKHKPEEYDHILFSYHGLPERQITKASDHYGSDFCKIDGHCCEHINARNQFCYRANCYATTRARADGLGLQRSQYTVCFQSRLGKTPWIKPYSDVVVEELGKKGLKKLLVFSPAFVADCLETLYEISSEYLEIFQKNGGEKIQLVESLNASPTWVKTVCEMVK